MTTTNDNPVAVVLPLEALSEKELRAIKRLKELSQAAGILIGALRGSCGSWDIRALLQTPNGTVILRATDPEFSLDANSARERAEGLRAALKVWGDSGLLGVSFAWGVDNGSGQIWLSRRWYEKLEQADVNETEFAQLVSGLIGVHGNGVGHGHLVKSNLIREAGAVKIIDPAIYLFSQPGAAGTDARAQDLSTLVDLAPTHLQGRVQSAVTTGRLSALTNLFERSSAAVAPLATTGAKMVPFTVERPEAGAKTRTPFIGLSTKSAVTALFVGVVALGGGAAWYFQEPEIIPVSEAAQFLASGQPSLMGRVAEAAVLGQRSAQALIVQAANEGRISESLYNRRLILLGFDPRWEAQLSDSDREVLLRLALSKLYPAGLQNAPSFSAVHPGVLLAVIADVDENKPAAFADNITLDGFASLPGEVGLSFKGLLTAGVTQVSDSSARALARIVGGSLVERDIQLVLAGKGAGARLRALVPLFEAQPKLARAVLTAIASGSGVLTELLRWLGSDFSAGWSKSPPQTILGILAGLPPSTLGVEQWADLLSFPETGVRRAAAVALSERFLKQETELVTLLAATEIGLSRSQTATLVSAFGLPPEERDTLLSRWFTSAPTPAALKALLLVRSAAAANDGFNLEVARALSNSAVTFTNPELRRLTQYRESLVRALAYSRLVVDDGEQRKILEECAQQEADQKLRDGLLERLSEYTRTQAALSK